MKLTDEELCLKAIKTIDELIRCLPREETVARFIEEFRRDLMFDVNRGKKARERFEKDKEWLRSEKLSRYAYHAICNWLPFEYVEVSKGAYIDVRKIAENALPHHCKKPYNYDEISKPIFL